VKRRRFPQKRRMSPNLRNRFFWTSLLLLFLIVSCGEGSPPLSVAKKGPHPSLGKSKSESVKTDVKKEAETEEYAYNPTGKPDPFKPFLQLTPMRQSRSVPLTPLQKYDLGQLKLVAVLSTPQGNVGLVEDATGKGYFVKRGTLIGKNDGKVSKVMSDRLIVEEVFLDVLGQKKVNETSLALNKVEEGGEK
jgi:type IV pilus assembly protein PilP